MEKTSKKTGVRRHSYLISVLVMVAIAILLWQFYKYRIANKNVHKLVSEKSKGLYSIRYQNLSFNELAGDLHVDYVEILADTSVFNRMVKDNTNPAIIIRISIPSLNILHVKTPKALLNKELEGVKVEINSPTIEIELSDFLKDTSGYSPGRDMYKQLLGNLLRVKIDSIEVNHAKLIVTNIHTGQTTFEGRNVSFLLTGILIDSLQKEDSTRILFSKELKGSCTEILLPANGGDYKYLFENLQFKSRT